MKIISLQAENIKRLTAIEITPDSSLVQITGRNGAGKTSVLDSIWWALCSAKHIQSHPIRAGAAKAVIRLDLGELVVTRRFTRREDETFTTTITVENADGARFGSPQAILDGLIGALTFDPLQFVRMEPKEQVKTLRALVPDVDFVMVDAANAADYSKRTELNRTEKSLRAQADAITVAEGAPAETIDESALVAQLEQAGKRNADIERESAKRTRAVDEIKAGRERSASMRRQITELQGQLEVNEAAIARIKATVEALPPLDAPIDTADVRRQIEEARTTNRNVLAAAQKTQLERRALEHEVAAGKLTKAIADRLAGVAASINAAKLPVAGLSFGDGQVMLNGLPFSQASDAEQLRTSMAIAMAGNPKLQVIRVRDGSLLDQDGMRLVEEMAEERGFQVWVERVDSSGTVGFVIEDGALKGAAIREAAE